MDHQSLDLFGRDSNRYFEALRRLRDGVSGRIYAFKALSAQDTIENPGRASAVIWRELLMRSHLAAILAIHRSLRWADGMTAAWREENYLAFVSSLRGFLESTADTFDCFRPIPGFFGTVKGAIDAIFTEPNPTLLVVPAFEERLIHFTHGRRLKKESPFPDSHRAKTTRNYLQSLDKAKVPRVLDLYELLCDSTHPAFDSTAFAIDLVEADVLKFNPLSDLKRIRELLDEYRGPIEQLPDFAFDEPVVTLGFLNMLPLAEFHTNNNLLPTSIIRERLRSQNRG